MATDLIAEMLRDNLPWPAIDDIVNSDRSPGAATRFCRPFKSGIRRRRPGAVQQGLCNNSELQLDAIHYFRRDD
jgi:hypothetical protein